MLTFGKGVCAPTRIPMASKEDQAGQSVDDKLKGDLPSAVLKPPRVTESVEGRWKEGGSRRMRRSQTKHFPTGEGASSERTIPGTVQKELKMHSQDPDRNLSPKRPCLEGQARGGRGL